MTPPVKRLKANAQPETVRRRAYHREYNQAKFGYRSVKCPTCSGNMRAQLGTSQCADCRYKYDRWDSCDCGKRKLKASVLCHRCAGLRGGRPGRPAPVKLEPNPFCPNPDEGAKVCGTRQPHNHCKYCSDPIRPDQGMCADCIRAVERGAVMDERDSQKFEEAA